MRFSLDLLIKSNQNHVSSFSLLSSSSLSSCLIVNSGSYISGDQHRGIGIFGGGGVGYTIFSDELGEDWTRFDGVLRKDSRDHSEPVWICQEPIRPDEPSFLLSFPTFLFLFP